MGGWVDEMEVMVGRGMGKVGEMEGAFAACNPARLLITFPCGPQCTDFGIEKSAGYEP